MAEKTRVLFVGETWLVLKLHVKGFDMVPLGGYENMAGWFLDALGAFSDVEVTHMPNHVALTDFPKTLDEMQQYDVIVFSDTGKNTIQLYPNMFDVPMGPNRLETLRAFVDAGGGFIMAGGWNCFEGIRGIPGYHDTAAEEILPVNMLPYDDRVETPQGVVPRITLADHGLFEGCPKEWPMFMGYNKVEAKSDGKLLATIDGNPFIVLGSYGKGRAIAFTSDLTKHWGTGFIEWDGYGRFWHNAVLWVAGRMAL
jgi:uncharacterized membrane protein